MIFIDNKEVNNREIDHMKVDPMVPFCCLPCVAITCYFDRIDQLHPCKYYMKFKFKNLKSFCEKNMLSTALGFEPSSFDCRSTALTTELHRRWTSPSPEEDFHISPSGSALWL